MRSSWATAILLGLVAASSSANAVVITPVSAVLTAYARSTSGLVEAAPVIVGATYGQFSNSAESRGEWMIGDFARASILTNIQPDELRLSGTAGALNYLGGPYAGASALVKFEVSTTSEWLLFVYGVDWSGWGPGPRLKLSNSSGTVYFFDSISCVVFDVELGRWTIGDCQLTLDPGLYSLEAVVATGVWSGPLSGADLRASLRPVPNTVPIPATFGTLGPDLLVFGLICVFGVLRPAWNRTRGT